MMDRVRGTSISPALMAVLFVVLLIVLRLFEVLVNWYLPVLLVAFATIGYLVGKVMQLQVQIDSYSHPVAVPVRETVIVDSDPLDLDDDDVTRTTTTIRPT